MKISIIGAGNVGGMTAMRLAEQNIGEVLLVDVAKDLSLGKVLDLEDGCSVLKSVCNLSATDQIAKIKDSQIVVITAGLARKPGMAREELVKKNAQIIKTICKETKALSPEGLIIVVSNPVDILTYLAIKELGFSRNRVFGLGVNLDAARFANLISRELNIPNADIDAAVIGAHGQTMLPLERFTYIKGVPLDQMLDLKKIEEIKQLTIQRGARIVSLLGSGSAYFAPSAAIANVIKIILKNEKRTLGLCAYLNGEYGLKDVCIGVPCRLGKEGIEKIIELELNQQEKNAFLASADSLKKQQVALNG